MEGIQMVSTWMAMRGAVWACFLKFSSSNILSLCVMPALFAHLSSVVEKGHSWWNHGQTSPIPPLNSALEEETEIKEP
ncbi:hypothetical protein BGZ63DRAFT_380517 [Mariannaea sp. PMI_226]|nr:hypothetical protein BGZ63DRAFT_380517 [Mariannaea sp. PMI_226]